MPATDAVFVSFALILLRVFGGGVSPSFLSPPSTLHPTPSTLTPLNLSMF